jgi:hypothetical protein
VHERGPGASRQPHDPAVAAAREGGPGDPWRHRCPRRPRRGATPRDAANHAAMPRTGACVHVRGSSVHRCPRRPRRGATPRDAANHAAMPRTGACVPEPRGLGRRGRAQGSRSPGASRRPHDPAVAAADRRSGREPRRGCAARPASMGSTPGRRPWRHRRPRRPRHGATPRDAANHAAMPRTMPRCHAEYAAMPCRICHVPCRPCIMPCRKCHAWHLACRAHAARTTLAFVVPTAEIRLAAPKAHRIRQHVAAYRWNLGATVFTAPLEHRRADRGALGLLRAMPIQCIDPRRAYTSCVRWNMWRDHVRSRTTRAVVRSLSLIARVANSLAWLTRAR